MNGWGLFIQKLLFFNEIIIYFSGLYHVYIQPQTEEGNLPENASYDSNDEILFPSANLLSDSGKLCEKGKTVKC